MDIPVTSDIHFIHNFPRNNKEFFPEQKFCIAYQMCDNGKVLNFGISVCSPKDLYDKSIGRKYATYRLENKPTTITIDKFKKDIFIKPTFYNVVYDLTDIIHLNCIHTFFDFKRTFLNNILKKYVFKI